MGGKFEIPADKQ